MLIPSFAEFKVDENSVSNNHGHLGECSALATVAGCDFVLSATLASNDPDSSDDELRSQCSLVVTLTADDKTIVTTGPQDYEYHGDTPGDHLLEVMDAGDLFDSLQQDVAQGTVSLEAGFAFA